MLALGAGGCQGHGARTDAASLMVTIAGDDAGTSAVAVDLGAPAQDVSRDEGDDTPVVFDAPFAAPDVPLEARPERPPFDAAVPDLVLRDALADVAARVDARDAPLDARRDVTDALAERVVDAPLPADARRDVAPAVPPGPPLQMCGRIRCDCTLRGIRLWGKVTYVTSGGTFKVSATGAPDLFVQANVVGTSCGEWAEVPQPQDADFTVEFVTSGQDFQIQYALAPGVAKPPGAP